MSHEDQPIDQPINTAMITMLQACGFDVSHDPFGGYLVQGTIESAATFYKLTVAGADASTAMLPMPVMEPVLWANFADNGNIRLWTTAPDKAKKFDLIPLYTAAPVPAASVQPDDRDKQIEGLAADVLRLEIALYKAQQPRIGLERFSEKMDALDAANPAPLERLMAAQRGGGPTP